MNSKEKIINDFIKYSGWWIAWEFKKHALEDEGYIPSKFGLNNITLFIGDSRVSGGQWFNVKSRSIINYGIGGTQFSGWTKFMALQRIIAENYKEIIIGLGGNDLGAGESDQKILGDLQKIIFILQKYSHTKIYVHCVLPIWRHGKAKNSDVVRLNKLLSKLCFLNNVNFIDFEDEFTLGNCIKIEFLNINEVPPVLWKKYPPVHLSGLGYEIWYSLLNNYFKEVDKND